MNEVIVDKYYMNLVVLEGIYEKHKEKKFEHLTLKLQLEIVQIFNDCVERIEKEDHNSENRIFLSKIYGWMNKQSRQKIANAQIQAELHVLYHDLGKSDKYLKKIDKAHKSDISFKDLSEENKEKIIKNFTKLAFNVHTSKEEKFISYVQEISKWIDPDDTIVKKYIHLASGLHYSPFPTRHHLLPRLVQRNKGIFDHSSKQLVQPDYAIFNEMFRKIGYQGEKYVLAFVDPGELSYHNFENILPMDYYFDEHKSLNTTAFVESFVKHPRMDVYQGKLNQNISDLILPLDNPGFYLAPFNSEERGGKRFIFRAQHLSDKLTKMIKDMEIPEFEKFSHINPIFRLNNFTPSDNKFSYHYDTAYCSPRDNHLSRYALVIYLTKGKNDTDGVLDIQDQNHVFKLTETDVGTCVIFSHKYNHQGIPYLDNNKLFLRTELVFNHEKSEMKSDPYLAKLFASSCYHLLKSLKFNDDSKVVQDIKQTSTQQFNLSNRARFNLNLAKKPMLEYRVWNMKLRDEMTDVFCTNGTDYYFDLGMKHELTKEEIKYFVMITLIDYFNGKLLFSSGYPSRGGDPNKIEENIVQKPLVSIKEAKDEKELLKKYTEVINKPENVFKRDYTYFENGGGNHIHNGKYTTKEATQLEEEIIFDDDYDCADRYDNYHSSCGIEKISVEQFNAEFEEAYEKEGLYHCVCIFDDIYVNKDCIKVNETSIQFDIHGLDHGINFASYDPYYDRSMCKCDGNVMNLTDSKILYQKGKGFNLPTLSYEIVDNYIHIIIDMFNNDFIATEDIHFPKVIGDWDSDGIVGHSLYIDNWEDEPEHDSADDDDHDYHMTYQGIEKYSLSCYTRKIDDGFMDVNVYKTHMCTDVELYSVECIQNSQLVKEIGFEGIESAPKKYKQLKINSQGKIIIQSYEDLKMSFSTIRFFMVNDLPHEVYDYVLVNPYGYDGIVKDFQDFFKEELAYLVNINFDPYDQHNYYPYRIIEEGYLNLIKYLTKNKYLFGPYHSDHMMPKEKDAQQKETGMFKVAIKFGHLEILKFFIRETRIANERNIKHLIDLALKYKQPEITDYLVNLK